MFGRDNIKVYFASAENIQNQAGIRYGGVHYALFSAYPLIAKKMKLKCASFMNGAVIERDEIPAVTSRNFKHVIMDSGIYTLAYGGMQNKLNDFELWYDYYTHMMDMVKTLPSNITVAEFDCQDALGIQTAWDMRNEMRKWYPDRDVINIWHPYSDGVEGLYKLIEYTNYLGLPVRGFLSKGDNLTRILMEVQRRKPGLRVHLFGGTSRKALTQGRQLAYSADSTAWNEGTRYGTISHMKKRHINHAVKLVDDNRLAKATEGLLDLTKATPATIFSVKAAAISAEINKRAYAVWAGDQE